MTKKELLDKLGKLSEKHDQDVEMLHMEADELLLKFIGDKEITDIFTYLEKWYA